MSRKQKKYKYKVEKEGVGRTQWADSILESKTATIVMGILAIAFGIVFAWGPMTEKVITYEEAEHASKYVDFCEAGKNFLTMYTTDGESYDFFPHTVKAELSERILALEKGTPVTISVNPHSQYIIALQADGEE